MDWFLIIIIALVILIAIVGFYCLISVVVEYKRKNEEARKKEEEKKEKEESTKTLLKEAINDAEQLTETLNKFFQSQGIDVKVQQPEEISSNKPRVIITGVERPNENKDKLN